MSEQLRESMSAAIDNQADAFELRRVLDEASVDGDLREEWHRLHLVRDLMQDEMCNFSPGLRDAVWQGLLHDDQQDEGTTELRSVEMAATSQRSTSPWLGRVTGGAVAVTAAVLVLINGGVLEDNNTPDSVDIAGSDNYLVSPVAPPGSQNPGDANVGELAPVMYQQATDADLHRHYGFMLRHIQQRAMNQNGLASFVKVATFTQPGTAPTASAEPTNAQ